MIAKPSEMVYVHLYVKQPSQHLAAPIQQFRTKKMYHLFQANDKDIIT